MVAKYTAARGMPELQLHVEAFGVFHYLTEKNERSTEVLAPAKDTRLYEVKERLNQEAEMHKADLVALLQDQVTTYPLFKDSKAYVPPVQTDHTAIYTEPGTQTGGVRHRL
jgi:hypothetical protein